MLRSPKLHCSLDVPDEPSRYRATRYGAVQKTVPGARCGCRLNTRYVVHEAGGGALLTGNKIKKPLVHTDNLVLLLTPPARSADSRLHRKLRP